MEQPTPITQPLHTTDLAWGESSSSHLGYQSEEERKRKRGLEDWELVENTPLSQKAVPYWFFAIIAVVFLVGVGLSFPFWGNRPGVTRPWLDWGYLVAFIYIAIAATFVYYMVRYFDKPSDPQDSTEVDASCSSHHHVTENQSHPN